jgi:chromosome segregation ATPase
LNTLDDRVTNLEREMKDVRRDVADTRLLASGASEEVGHLRLELRAHTKTLEALRETQLEQRDEMRAGFAKVDERFAKTDERFITLETEMRDGFASNDKRFADLETEMRDGFASNHQRVANLETKMRDGFASSDKRVANLETEMRDGFGKLSLGMAQITALLNIAIKQDGD